ncbi:hypothetical protein BC332_06524 [Capsicum chinense]|nr:hypothetical protein BC332_06524 [Capsicum chinense]
MLLLTLTSSNSHVSFSVKGPLEFDCKVFNRVPQRDISTEFLSPNAPIDSIPPVLRINDYKWVDTGQLSDSFDRHQYNQIKLLNAPKLFDKMAERSRWLSMLHYSEYIGEVEVLIECSDNLTSFCNSYKLLGISLDNSFLYSLDWAATSRVERSYICPLSDKVALATILSLLTELYSSEQVELGLPLLLPFDFRCKIGNFTWQINMKLVISQPVLILEWIDSLKSWTPLSPQQEQVEGILMLVGQIEGLSDYDYDLCVVYVPDGKFLSSIGPTDVNYWERYTGPNSVKEWRKHFNIILPMLVSSIRVTYGAYIVTCFVDVKKCILMFFEISENRAEHNNLYEAISKNIHFGILVATNSLALSSVVLEHSKMDLVAKLAAGVTQIFGLSMALTYVTVDVVSHVLIYAYTTILRIFTKTAYSFHNITRMQEYLQDPSKFTTITLAPVPTTFCDPYGTQTWRKPLETTDA